MYVCITTYICTRLILEREEEEASKADERKQQAEIVIASWQKQKGEKLKGLHAKQAKQREEEKQRLEQEAERKSISRLAFDKWYVSRCYPTTYNIWLYC